MKPGGSEILGSSKKGTMETNSSIQFATTPRLLHDLHNDFLSEGARGFRQDVLDHSNRRTNDKQTKT